MKIYCCGCVQTVSPRLTNGREVYPHQSSLRSVPYWKCDVCQNYVGCHHKTGNPTAPLGCIPTPELRSARRHIHAILDPIWKTGRMKRKELYAKVSASIGWKYHTAGVSSIEEARIVYRAILDISR